MTTPAVNGPANDTAAPRSAADRVIVFDTTMRDGEQSPGASMSLAGAVMMFVSSRWLLGVRLA